MEPRTLAEFFVRRFQHATDKDAIRFAKERFPGSPLAIALFLAHWRSMRQRLLAALHGHGDLTWEPAHVERSNRPEAPSP